MKKARVAMVVTIALIMLPLSAVKRKECENVNQAGPVRKMLKVPNEHRVPLKDYYVSLIMLGVKTVEGRINSGIFRNMKIGNLISFFSSKKQVKVQVTQKNVYKSFEEMLSHEGIKNILPGARSVQEGVNIYHSFPNYEERVKTDGAVALTIKRIEQ